ncbi:MAG: alkaline phosphatase family protein, partial [Planctomycetota bacterium]
MKLPRWTAYLALSVLAVGLITAVPSRRKNSREGAARTAREGEPVDTTYERFVVLGIDGMDPDILAEVIERYPDRMQNFRRLIEHGSGIRELGTSTPPQSPVAWSNFITGRDPGGHGIFDFIHRDVETYSMVLGNVTATHTGSVWLPGQWKFPTQAGGDSNRSGEAFWTTLGKRGVPADVWRMPINFPVEPSAEGLSFPGMMTPAVDSAYGEPSFYSTDPPIESLEQEKVIQIVVRSGVVHTYLLGPNNSFKDGDPRTRIPLDIYVDEVANAIAIELGGSSLVLEPGQWSTFVPVSFSMLPLGLMDVGGIVRFYLRSITPELELYASPINIDPTAPISPVSAPDSASRELAEKIGLYYTAGMPEDV